MNLKQTVYFMALVGAIAGLCCWTTQIWLSDYLVGNQERIWLYVALSATLMGTFIGGMTVGFADHWTSDKVVPSWVLIGVVLGGIAGFLSGLMYIPLEARVVRANPGQVAAVIGRSLIWLIAGGMIGLVTGLRWVGANPLRAVHALIGGLLGGALGGLVVALGTSQEFFQALAYMLTGMGITLGVTLAPVLLSDGVLRFVSSGDPRAQNKYGSPRQEWVIQDGDHLVIGSQSADMSSTMWTQEVQIYIPDAMVGPRHAVMFSKKKRFFLQLHPDNAGPQGQPLEPLQIGDANVVGTRELRNGDEIVVGQTLLRFTTKRKQAALEDQADERGTR
jgi:hypothetical protein